MQSELKDGNNQGTDIISENENQSKFENINKNENENEKQNQFKTGPNHNNDEHKIKNEEITNLNVNPDSTKDDINHEKLKETDIDKENKELICYLLVSFFLNLLCIITGFIYICYKYNSIKKKWLVCLVSLIPFLIWTTIIILSIFSYKKLIKYSWV
jgi:hypothetical protein